MSEMVERIAVATRQHMAATGSNFSTFNEGLEGLARAALEAMPRPWQNIDHILNALDKAECSRHGHVYAAEDVVAKAIRDWLNAEINEALK